MLGDGDYVVDVKPKKQETDGFLDVTKFWVENMFLFSISKWRKHQNKISKLTKN